MESEQFEVKIRALRQLWDEKRQTAQLSTGDEFASRLELLQLIHHWLDDSLEAINRYYGDVPGTRLGPVPGPDDATAGFTLTLFDQYMLRFRMVSRRGPAGQVWAVAGEAGNLGARPMLTALGPTRRHGQWTRERIEQILLSILSQFERDRLEQGQGRDRAGRPSLAKLTLLEFSGGNSTTGT